MILFETFLSNRIRERIVLMSPYRNVRRKRESCFKDEWRKEKNDEKYFARTYLMETFQTTTRANNLK